VIDGDAMCFDVVHNITLEISGDTVPEVFAGLFEGAMDTAIEADRLQERLIEINPNSTVIVFPSPVDAPVDAPTDAPTPLEPTPAEPTPAEPTPAEPTPAEPTPAEPTPAEPTPAEPTPAEPPPAEQIGRASWGGGVGG
jgi:cell division septation protein DedD